MPGQQDLIKTIEGIDMFSVFARLMRTSGMNDIIGDAKGPLTVFAPTNDAFGMVPDKVMNGWLSETSQKMLCSVLAYHIVADRLPAGDLGSGKKTASSISGKELRFLDSSGLTVNGASVEARDIAATDGVIHALGTVLAPPKTNDEQLDAVWSGDSALIQGDISPRKDTNAHESSDRSAISRKPSTAPLSPARRIAPWPERKLKLS